MGAVAESSAVNVNVLRYACGCCSLCELCWPMGLDQSDLERLQSMVRRSGPFPAGSHLFRAHDPFTGVYAVRSGCIKSYSVDAAGHEQIHGFHLPGELLGFDAVYPESHRCKALILRTCSVCIVPYRELAQLPAELHSLQMQILRLMNREFSKQLMLVNSCGASQSLAILLLDLRARLQRDGYPRFEFMLPMSQEDIANYLGFTAETMSRVTAKLKHAKIIEVDRRKVRLLDLKHLQLIAQGVDSLH